MHNHLNQKPKRNMINNLGVDPYEWFDTRFINSLFIAEEEPIEDSSSRQDPPAELMEVPTSVKNPKPPKKIEEEKKTPHHIAYEIATSKYNPFAVGGSENICELGGSENRI